MGLLKVINKIVSAGVTSHRRPNTPKHLGLWAGPVGLARWRREGGASVILMDTVVSSGMGHFNEALF